MPSRANRLSPAAVRARARRVRLLLCDVDGVLTDGGIYVSERGEAKRFFVQDGLGLRALQRAGLKVGWITARPSPATRRRAKELQTDFLIQTTGGKVPAAAGILRQAGCDWAEVCFIGDDLVDLALLARVGLAVCPANGCAEARSAAHHVTARGGGHGAVREVVEMILKAQGKWTKVVAETAR